MEDQENLKFMREAAAMAIQGVQHNEGGPFGAVVVKDGKIIGKGNNRVLITNDPTAHAEVLAIREACNHLKNFQLEGCVLYTTCEPCPMCLGAIYWARLDKMYYACTRNDAAAIGFDDEFIYREIPLSFSERKIKGIQLGLEVGLKAFRFWEEKEDKKLY